MTTEIQVTHPVGEPVRGAVPPGDPCVLVLFGASGDLTKRLLMPALYNLACDGLLPRHFAIVGTALDALSTEQFRARLTDDVQRFTDRCANKIKTSRCHWLDFQVFFGQVT